MYFVALGVRALRTAEIHTFPSRHAAEHFYDAAQSCGAQVAGHRCDRMGLGKHDDPAECIRRAWSFTIVNGG